MKRTLTFATMLVAFAVLTIVGVFHETRKVHAQDQLPPPVGDRISFGLVTLTTGQTARINVANVIAQGDADFPPGPSRVAILMVDSSGNPFRTRDGSPIRRVVMLGRGESTFLELNADDFAIGAGGRIQLRAVVTFIHHQSQTALRFRQILACRRLRSLITRTAEQHSRYPGFRLFRGYFQHQLLSDLTCGILSVLDVVRKKRDAICNIPNSLSD